MQLLVFFIYIAIIPIVLSIFKAIGVEERFTEGEEYIENNFNK